MRGTARLVTETDAAKKLLEVIGEIPIAMLTTFGPEGPRSVPMARQEVEPSAELWFITARETAHVDAIRADPRVALTFSARDAWAAAYGRASVVDDRAKLEDLWGAFAEAWLPGGPDDPNATLLRVDLEGGEYWDTPGGRVASLISFAKSKLTGETYNAEHGSVDGL